jgi:hypothetical protein
MSDKDELPKNPAGISRRSFFSKSAAAAAGAAAGSVAEKKASAQVVPPVDASKVNELLGEFGKACKGSEWAERDLTMIREFMDPDHGRVFYDTIKEKDFAAGLTSDIQKMREQLAARKTAFETLCEVLSDTPFAVPFGKRQAHGVIAAAMNEKKITRQSLEAAFTADQIRLQGLLDFAEKNYATIVKTQAAQRAASKALWEAFPHDSWGNLGSGSGQKNMAPQEFWNLPPAKVVEHVRAQQAQEEARQDDEIVKKRGDEYKERAQEVVAELKQFFGLTFKNKDGNYVARMKWPENADVHRFEGAMQSLVMADARYSYMHLNEPVGNRIPDGHEFFKGTLAPGNQVTFTLPQYAAIALMNEVSRVQQDEFYFDSEQCRLRSERVPKLVREYIEKEENVRQAVDRLECIRNFGGANWIKKIRSGSIKPSQQSREH